LRALTKRLRVPLDEDLVRYKQQDETERQKLVDELTAEAQRLGLDY